MALDAGVLISFDPNLRPELLPPDEARTAFEPFMQAADVMMPTVEELRQLTDNPPDDTAALITHWIDRKPERLIVVTEGAAGCTVYDVQGSQHIDGFSVEEVDPTGAGDCFDAGFLVGRLNGESVTEAARLANACGALAVRKRGPMAGAATMQRVQQFITEQSR
jgi:sugar/nucleoside kinase (ribokinase family)